MHVGVISVLLAADARQLHSLSEPRRMLAGVAVGNEVLFAGGVDGKNASEAVDVYDGNGRWLRRDSLSAPRCVMATAALGEMAFFAGGQDGHGNKSDVVDLYNASSATWTTARLSQARSLLAAVAVADVVLFGGGELVENEGNTSTADDTARVDVYNVTADRWSSAASLSVARKKLSATSVQDVAIFAGGYLSHSGSRAEVDIFNATSGEWSVATLSAPRMRLQAATAGGKAFFVSGMNEACGNDCPVVDLYDPAVPDPARRWSTTQLSRGRYEFAAVGIADQLVVTGGKQFPSNSTGGKWDLVEIYDISTATWRTSVVPGEARSYAAAAAIAPTRAAASMSVPSVLVAGGDWQNGTTADSVELLSFS